MMWSVTTSRGSRVDGIKCEQDARRTVHMLGITAVIGPYISRGLLRSGGWCAVESMCRGQSG